MRRSRTAADRVRSSLLRPIVLAARVRRFSVTRSSKNTAMIKTY
ncbi:hypothetical protein BN903_281 [Halorubrum sp. AJ67]|nr:hypothetical protein BN903_281 [Halorubrum sp. AJ67]